MNRFSGLLFESTQNQLHKDGAELSAEFIKNHWYDEDLKIIQDAMDIRTCQSQNAFHLCYNTGKTFEATSILASGNQTWTPL